ncbi:hypothetical protein [Mycolicibacterium fortuitum]|uniref:hypothetical protein n=1 Tax=Mycolicibacterium fortuitum TaxID=1766 RepID=UPI0026342819|nr:hypothetical protein [Mycolicibacterium fortuitum]
MLNGKLIAAQHDDKGNLPRDGFVCVQQRFLWRLNIGPVSAEGEQGRLEVGFHADLESQREIGRSCELGKGDFHIVSGQFDRKSVSPPDGARAE